MSKKLLINNNKGKGFLIAHYIFNPFSETVPTFNDEFSYFLEDLVIDKNNVERKIYSDILPSSIYFTGGSGLQEISYLETSELTTATRMFSMCSNVHTINLNKSFLSNIKNTQYMFYNCYKLENINLSTFDTSKVTNSYDMFKGVPSSANIIVSNKFNLTESQTSFKGTFNKI